jgi:hypothetical protein
MTSKTNTTKKPVASKKQAIATVAATPVSSTTQSDEDAKNALLIVSLAVNIFVLVAWVTLQVTSAYDYQVASFLFVR